MIILFAHNGSVLKLVRARALQFKHGDRVELRKKRLTARLKLFPQCSKTCYYHQRYERPDTPCREISEWVAERVQKLVKS